MLLYVWCFGNDTLLLVPSGVSMYEPLHRWCSCFPSGWRSLPGATSRKRSRFMGTGTSNVWEKSILWQEFTGPSYSSVASWWMIVWYYGLRAHLTLWMKDLNIEFPMQSKIVPRVQGSTISSIWDLITSFIGVVAKWETTCILLCIPIFPAVCINIIFCY